MENKYLLSDIVIDGIEPAEEWKELMERERRGELTAEEIEKIVRLFDFPYQIPTDK